MRWFTKLLEAWHSIGIFCLAVVLWVYAWNERKIAEMEADLSETSVFTECEMDTLSRLKYRYQNTEEVNR